MPCFVKRGARVAINFTMEIIQRRVSRKKNCTDNKTEISRPNEKGPL
jgi:hypothetical protein